MEAFHVWKLVVHSCAQPSFHAVHLVIIIWLWWGGGMVGGGEGIYNIMLRLAVPAAADSASLGEGGRGGWREGEGKEG